MLSLRIHNYFLVFLQDSEILKGPNWTENTWYLNGFCHDKTLFKFFIRYKNKSGTSLTLFGTFTFLKITDNQL